MMSWPRKVQRESVACGGRAKSSRATDIGMEPASRGVARQPANSSWPIHTSGTRYATEPPIHMMAPPRAWSVNGETSQIRGAVAYRG